MTSVCAAADVDSSAMAMRATRMLLGARRKRAALEREAGGSVARRHVDHAAFAEADDQSAKRDSHTLEQLALRVHDVVHELALLRCRRCRRQDPEIPVLVGECGALA